MEVTFLGISPLMPCPAPSSPSRLLVAPSKGIPAHCPLVPHSTIQAVTTQTQLLPWQLPCGRRTQHHQHEHQRERRLLRRLQGILHQQHQQQLQHQKRQQPQRHCRPPSRAGRRCADRASRFLPVWGPVVLRSCAASPSACGTESNPNANAYASVSAIAYASAATAETCGVCRAVSGGRRVFLPPGGPRSRSMRALMGTVRGRSWTLLASFSREWDLYGREPEPWRRRQQLQQQLQQQPQQQQQQQQGQGEEVEGVAATAESAGGSSTQIRDGGEAGGGKGGDPDRGVAGGVGRRGRRLKDGEEEEGAGEERRCILQAFSWTSHRVRDESRSPLYLQLLSRVEEIAASGFTDVLLPPCSAAADPQGFQPADYYCLDSAYGSEVELRQLLQRLRQHGLGACLEVVVTRPNEGLHYSGNSSNGSVTGNDSGSGRHDDTPSSWRRYANLADEAVTPWPYSTPTNTSPAAHTSVAATAAASASSGTVTSTMEVDSGGVGGEGGDGPLDAGQQQVQQQEQQQPPPPLLLPQQRPMDHSNPFVEEDCKGWLLWLKEDHGYTAWCFDFSYGFDPLAFYSYCRDTQPEFAVADVWTAMRYNGPALEYDQDQHRAALCDWVKASRGSALVLDYTTKGILQQAVAAREFWRLIDPQGRPPGLIGIMPSHAVTFVDNHMTGSEPQKWPFPAWGVMLGYAYILTHPGTPCVFYEHLYDWNLMAPILLLLAVRRRNGVVATSSVDILACTPDLYVARVGQRQRRRRRRKPLTPQDQQHQEQELQQQQQQPGAAQGGGNGGISSSETECRLDEEVGEEENQFEGVVVKIGPAFDMRGTCPDSSWRVAASGVDYCVWEPCRDV